MTHWVLRAGQLALGRHVKGPAANGDKAVHSRVVGDLRRGASVVGESEGKRSCSWDMVHHCWRRLLPVGRSAGQSRTVISLTTLE